MEKNLIIRLNDSASPQTSPESVKINKLTSSISPLNFVKLIYQADNKVNPRIAKDNRITSDIKETLAVSPSLFFYKSKGLLLATQSCKTLERNRIELSFEDLDHEGIMDGGHNALAIASYIIEQLFEDVAIEKWEDCKNFWSENYEEILEKFKDKQDEFRFSIPVEIIFPNGEEGSLEEYYDHIFEICSARNNNVQLKETAKGNQAGFYDLLKELLDPNIFKVIWKTGDSGNIKAEDVISIATLPLIFLQKNGKLPAEVKTLNKINIYSQKGKCVDFYNSLMREPSVSEKIDGTYLIKNEYVKSALSLTADLLEFFDQMYIAFPSLYNKTSSPGRFGGIKAVNNSKYGKVPFYTTEDTAPCQYSFGFFLPLVAGLTELMEIDEESQSVYWKVNPNEINLSDLDLTQYVNIIKLANFDPQKIGKGEVFYNDAETVFQKIAESVE